MISQHSLTISNKLYQYLSYLFHFGLVILILFGLYLRFAWVNWSQGANLHPDEYGLTNTLTQLSIPKSIADYFNTRDSSLSPYPRYDEAGQIVENGPDNAMRWGQWPITMIRFVAEETGNTDYNSLRLTGRSLSALADAITVLLILMIGIRIHSRSAGLLAACFSALSVLQIQQSHFMTVDNFSVMFSTLAIYACVRIAQEPSLHRGTSNTGESNASDPYYPSWISLSWYIIFGVAYGMALASKINLLPLGGIVFIAGFIGIADLKLKTQRDLRRIFLIWILFTIVSLFVTGIIFRLSQPMSFRQQTGETAVFTLHLNPDWVENMKQAQLGSNGIGTGPPGDQWAHRPAIIFPWINIVFWGMGLPLGLLSWAGFVWAAWRYGLLRANVLLL